MKEKKKKKKAWNERITMVRRRVHISNATLSFLNGEFEVEPAHGEDREEALQKAGIVTYFIVRALKPFIPAVTKSLASLTDAENSRRAMENLGDGRNNKEDSEEFRQRLRKELDSKSKQIETSFLISITNYFFLSLFFSFFFFFSKYRHLILIEY